MRTSGATLALTIDSVDRTSAADYFRKSSLMKSLTIFLALQLMDIATTLVALDLGAAEQNPIVGHFLSLGPVGGLLLSKLVVMGLAGLFVSAGRMQTIRLANFCFGLIVAWNISIIGRLAGIV
jgi:hypothetical protein